MNKFICLVGMCGSGKSEAADWFVKQGYGYIRFGQITLDELKRRGLDINEENERMIREDFRKQHGQAAYAIINMPKFDALLEQGNLIGDGLYSWSEYKVLKDTYGEDLIVICIYASPATRYQRLVNRAIRHDSTREDKYRSFDKEQAQARDFAEIENIEKAGPIAMADYTIINEGDISNLHQQLQNIYNTIHGSA